MEMTQPLVQLLTRQDFKDLFNTDIEYDTRDFWTQDITKFIFCTGNTLASVLDAIEDSHLGMDYFDVYLVNNDMYFAMKHVE